MFFTATVFNFLIERPLAAKISHCVLKSDHLKTTHCTVVHNVCAQY